MLKDFLDYRNGEYCGIQFSMKYIDGIEVTESSDAQRLGQWFEYVITGALPKNGQKPMPKMIGKSKDEYAAEYKRMFAHVERFKQILQEYRVTILNKAEKIKYKAFEGTIDLKAHIIPSDHQNYAGKAIIDIKTTGLINDRWSDFGWDIEMLPSKERTMLQAVHYVWLYRQVHGEHVPFFFFVFSNTNEYDCKLIRVDVSEERLEQHQLQVENAVKIINAEAKKGFKARPGIKRCAECLVRTDCKFKTNIPLEINTIEL